MAKKTYGHPLRSTWYAMIRRCHHTNDARYKDYGARGIVVCDRWRNSFDSFASDMGTKPSPLHTLDRVNNDGNYEPSNCRWADKKTQNSNTRNTLMVTWDGKTQTMSQWARDLGISNGTLWNRLQNMTIEDAMTQSIDELSRVRKWTLSEIDTVLEMHESGKALRVIAEEVHASKECVKRLIWRLTPIPKTPAQPATAAKCTCGHERVHHDDGDCCAMGGVHGQPYCECGGYVAAPPSPAAREATNWRCPTKDADGNQCVFGKGHTEDHTVVKGDKYRPLIDNSSNRYERAWSDLRGCIEILSEAAGKHADKMDERIKNMIEATSEALSALDAARSKEGK